MATTPPPRPDPWDGPLIWTMGSACPMHGIYPPRDAYCPGCPPWQPVAPRHYRSPLLRTDDEAATAARRLLDAEPDRLAPARGVLVTVTLGVLLYALGWVAWRVLAG